MGEFYFDRPSNVILYPGVAAPQLQHLGADIRQLNGTAFATLRTLRNLQILRHQNYPVPPIIDEESYDFPIERGRKPLPHQILCANFLALHPKCFNLSDAGSMKTLSTLWAIDFLMRQSKEPTKALILCPLSIVEAVWATGIFRNFLGKRKFKVLVGDNDKRMSLLAEDVDFYILNFDGIKVGARIKKGEIELDGFSKALADRKDIKIVAVDEATAFKTHTNARSRIYKRALQDRPYQFLLTGTPVNNSPLDAYGMAKIINNAHGKSFSGFRAETMFKVSTFLWKPQKDAYEKARRLLTPAIRFALEDVWAGPEMTFQRRQIELTPEQKKLMADLKRDLIIQTKSGKAIDAANEAAARWKLIQLSLGAVYDSDHASHIVDAAPRYKEVGDIIESTTRKVVIFVPITSIVHLLKKRLEERFKKQWKFDFINGEVGPKQRLKLIQEFASDPEFKAIIADPQTVGHGVNEFVVADTVIWMAPVDKTESWLQGNARVRRPGQQFPSTCFQLFSTKLEAEIFDRLESNTSMQGLMLQAIREGKF